MKGKFDSPDRFRQQIIDRIKIIAGLYTEVRIMLHRVRGCQSLQFKSASEVIYQVGLSGRCHPAANDCLEAGGPPDQWLRVH